MRNEDNFREKKVIFGAAQCTERCALHKYRTACLCVYRAPSKSCVHREEEVPFVATDSASISSNYLSSPCFIIASTTKLVKWNYGKFHELVRTSVANAPVRRAAKQLNSKECEGNVLLYIAQRYNNNNSIVCKLLRR